MHTTAKTALRRRKLSAPVKWLLDQGLLGQKILDYGCGRGDDVRHLQQLKPQAFVEGWDPHWTEGSAPRDSYDTVLCTYVGNVLPLRERVELWDQLATYHQFVGSDVFVTVRRDGKGQTPSQDFEVDVAMEHGAAWDLVRSTSQYAIYALRLVHGEERP